MECNKIQEKLPAYIDGVISSEERMLVDEHLKSCKKCKELLADLRKTVEYVHDLEDVEPPAWLRQKIMARIRSEAKPKKGILQKLFYPLHIKLPLEAAAFLIALTALYVFKTIQPEMKFAKAPSEDTVTQILSAEKEKIPPSPSSEKGGKRGFEAGQPLLGGKPETTEKVAEAPKAPTQGLRETETPYAIRPPEGALAKDESKADGLLSVQKAKTLAKKKEEIISLTINVKDIKTAGKEVEEALMQLGGKMIRAESFDERDVITAELDSNKLKKLIEKLRLIGEAKEDMLILEVMEGDVRVAIEIVKPSMK